MNELTVVSKGADWRRLKSLVLDSVSSPRLPGLHSLAVPPALSVAFFFARRRCSIAVLGLPARPPPGRSPTSLTAIALRRPLRMESLLTSFQETVARPWGTPRSAAWSGCRPVFLMFSRACRILVRAHGSVAPGSSCPGGDWHSSPGCNRFRFSLTSLSQYRLPPPNLSARFLPYCSAVRPVRPRPAGTRLCHPPLAPWPLLALPFWPYAHCHQQFKWTKQIASHFGQGLAISWPGARP